MTDSMTRTVTQRNIVHGLNQLGLESGNVVLVHSSLSSFGHVDGGEHAVIDALIQVIGQSGLLVMPTHTWGTVNATQPVFHETLSPSIVGKITETFRHRPGVVRSLHPTHSVAALGRRSEEFVEGHGRWSTPCASDSPYGRLVSEDGYVLFLGASLHSFTLMHGFEEWAQVPWLFNRVENLYTVRENGQILYVPSRRHSNEPGLDRDYPAFEGLLHAHGLIRSVTVGQAQLRLVSARGAKELLVPLYEQHPDLPLTRRSTPVPEC